MKHIRHAITAVTLIAGTVAMSAPASAGAALAPQTAQDGAVQQFWQFMYGLQTTNAQCVAITQSTHSTAATQFPVVFGGSCLQAFLAALYSNGSVAWEYVS